MRRTAIGLVGAAILALTASVSAAQPPSVGPVTPARLALAQRVVDTARLGRGMSLVIDAMLGPFIQQIRSGDGADALKSYVVDLMKVEAADMEAKMIPKLAEIYAENFNDQQLRDMLAFYASPTGRVLVDKQAALAREGQLAVAPLVPPMQRDIIDKLFAHVCQVQACTPAQRQQIEATRTQVLNKLLAQPTALPSTAAPTTPLVTPPQPQ
jgi:hypothetical protein